MTRVPNFTLTDFNSPRFFTPTRVKPATYQFLKFEIDEKYFHYPVWKKDSKKKETFELENMSVRKINCNSTRFE